MWVEWSKEVEGPTEIGRQVGGGFVKQKKWRGFSYLLQWINLSADNWNGLWSYLIISDLPGKISELDGWLIIVGGFCFVHIEMDSATNTIRIYPWIVDRHFHGLMLTI